MFDAPLHPKLVHLPLGLAMFLPLLFAMLLVAIRRAWLPAKAWWLAVVGAALLGLGTLAATRSGEADAEWVEPVVGEALVEAHEQAGEQLLVAAAVTLLLAAMAAFARRRQGAGRLQALATLGAIVTLVMAIRAGSLGGQLVYEHGAASAFSATPRAGPDTSSRAESGTARDEEGD